MNQNQKNGKKRKRLGEILIDADLIDQGTLDKALELGKVEGKKIGEVLKDMGAVSDSDVANALSSQLNIPLIHIKDRKIPQEVIALIPRDIAEKYSLIPIEVKKEGLIVAIVNPLELYAASDLKFATGMQIKIVISPESEIIEAYKQYYPGWDLENESLSDEQTNDAMEVILDRKTDEDEDKDLLGLAELAPVIRFTNAILADAIGMKASDIHIEPQKASLLIRCRVDGVMQEMMQADKHVHSSVVSRLKVLSNMDISIKRKPQDGKAQVRFTGKYYDLRVSTIPTSYGEKVTIRILDPDTALLVPDDLGFSREDLEHLSNGISMPQGTVLVTGPTGSGKSSTLYACLNRLNTPAVNIITVEDPVEFDVTGINQVQINPAAGITFAAGLRSILRQDPDVVMLGEIRDSETAGIAFEAAQTGHLVLSTLHTNDAPSSITRLLDLGVADFQITSALSLVIAQRLARKVCPDCKIPDDPNEQLMNRIAPLIMGKDDVRFWKGEGCDKCGGTGYKGRLGIFEVLVMTPSLKAVVSSDVSIVDLKEAAGRDGFKTLLEDGIDKAIKGLTTVEEVLRIAPIEMMPKGKMPEKIRKPAPLPPEPSISGFEASKPQKQQSEIPVGEVPVFVGSPVTAAEVSSPKILVVDDNEIVVDVLKNTLESEGYEVITAENGKAALALSLDYIPGLVITDLNMPEMDGIAFVKELKARESTENIPVIMLTARGEIESEVEGFESGADDYLVKPVNPKKLLARIKRFLRR